MRDTCDADSAKSDFDPVTSAVMYKSGVNAGGYAVSHEAKILSDDAAHATTNKIPHV